MSRRVRSLGLVCSTIVGSLVLLGATASAQTVPLNDNFAGATVITSTPYTTSEDTSLATTEDPSTDPAPCSGNIARSVWYAYTATATGRLQADTIGSNYDTVLSVFTGSAGALTVLGCNDDSQCSLQSTVAFDAVAGQTYYIRVSSYADGLPTSALTFNLGTPNAPPPFTASASVSSAEVSSSTGIVRLTGTVTCSAAGFYNLYVNAQQATGRGTNTGSGFVGGPCGTTPTTWTAVFSSSSGRFGGGPVTVTANGAAYSFGSCGGSAYAPINLSTTTTLRGTAFKNATAGVSMCFR